MKITVYYSCNLCSLVKRAVEVTARGEEDVIAWMESTVLVLARDHSNVSPACQATSLQDLMIPMSGRDKIGGPAIS